MKSCSLFGALILGAASCVGCDGGARSCYASEGDEVRAIVADERCGLLYLHQSELTNLSSFAALERRADIILSENALLDSTEDLPDIFGSVRLVGNPALSDASIRSSDRVWISTDSVVERLSWEVVPRPETEEDRINTLLTSENSALNSVSISCRNLSCSTDLQLVDPSLLVSIELGEGVDVVKLLWIRTTPSTLEQLVAIGPVAQAEFQIMSPEAIPVLRQYRDWLSSRNPGARFVALDGDNQSLFE